MRIIGYGNRERGDDGAGIAAAERLRAQGYNALAVSGDVLQVVEALRGTGEAILIDAVVTGAPAGTLHHWDASQPLPAGLSSTSTHGFGLAQGLELARSLGLLPPRVSVWGIEGKSFDMGAELSPPVKWAVEELTQRLAFEIAISSRKSR